METFIRLLVVTLLLSGCADKYDREYQARITEHCASKGVTRINFIGIDDVARDLRDPHCRDFAIDYLEDVATDDGVLEAKELVAQYDREQRPLCAYVFPPPPDKKSLKAIEDSVKAANQKKRNEASAFLNSLEEKQ